MSDDVTENVTTPNAIVEGKYAYMLKRPCTCGHTQAEHVKIDGTVERAGSCYHCGADGCLEFKSIHAYNSYPPIDLPGIKQRVLNVVDDAAAKLKEACKAPTTTTVAERRAGSDRRTTHYGSADDPYEAIKVIEAWGLNFSLGSALKYIRRAGHKATSTAVEDLEKAQAYVGFELARLKREQK